MSLPIEISVHSLLAFLEYLHSKPLSHKVILNYLSSIKSVGRKYKWNLHPFSHHLILSYIRSISINSINRTLALMSTTCNILDDPPSFIRLPFCLFFFAFLRISNVAPHSRFKFDSNTHFLRQYIIVLKLILHLL